MSFGFGGTGSGLGSGGSGGTGGVPTFSVSNVGQLTSLTSAVVGSLVRIPSAGVSYILNANPPTDSANWVVLPSGSGSRPTIHTVANTGSLVGITSALQGDLASVTSNSKTYSLQYDPYSTLSNWIELLSPSGSTQGASVSIFQNRSGATLPAFRPVQLDPTYGTIALVDVSVLTSSADTFGVTQTAIADNASGSVTMEGRLLNISGSWSFGSTIWVSKGGSLTDVAPDLGANGFVTGDLVIRVGYIAANASNPAQYDLIIEMQVVGTL